MSQSGPRRPASPVYIPSSFGLACKEAADGIEEAAKMGVNITVLKDGKTQTMDLEEYEATQSGVYGLGVWRAGTDSSMDEVLRIADGLHIELRPKDKKDYIPAVYLAVVGGLAALGWDAIAPTWPFVILVYESIVAVAAIAVLRANSEAKFLGSRYTKTQVYRAWQQRQRHMHQATIGDLTAVVDVTGGELSVCEQGQLTGVER